MSTAADRHALAMSHYDTALTARAAGDESTFRSAVVLALEEEAAAAKVFEADHAVEPTRSILYRSAATIALTACEFSRALELAASGLASPSTPAEIRAELVGLVKDANYRLHVLETEQVVIGDESVVLSLEGEAVGNGMVRQDVFKSKLNAVVNVINRTVDRLLGVPFGQARDSMSAPLYISPPVAGSFAIQVRLGDQRQPDLEGMPGRVDVDAVLSEVVESFEEFKDGDLDALRSRMRDSDYFQNFMALGRVLQPDGEKITAVELVGNLHRGVKRVRLTTPRPRPVRRKTPVENAPETREITGLLRVAEKRGEGREHVEVLDENGKWHVIHVPAALMADVVRPLWDSRVTITAKVGKRNALELEQIDQA